MIVATNLQVECVNRECPRPAKASVSVPEVAPGVVSIPTNLRCKTCGHDVKVTADA